MGTFQYMGGGNSEAQDRLATSFLLAQTSPGLATTGVLSGLAVTQTPTASGAVLVAAGAAPVQASVGTGVALLVNDTQATLDVLTAHPMGGLPRNDIVAFDSVTKALIAIKGEPNATPDDPTVPATACRNRASAHAVSGTVGSSGVAFGVPMIAMRALVTESNATTSLRGRPPIGFAVNTSKVACVSLTSSATPTPTDAWTGAAAAATSTAPDAVVVCVTARPDRTPVVARPGEVCARRNDVARRSWASELPSSKYWNVVIRPPFRDRTRAGVPQDQPCSPSM